MPCGRLTPASGGVAVAGILVRLRSHRRGPRHVLRRNDHALLRGGRRWIFCCAGAAHRPGSRLRASRPARSGAGRPSRSLRSSSARPGAQSALETPRMPKAQTRTCVAARAESSRAEPSSLGDVLEGPAHLAGVQLRADQRGEHQAGLVPPWASLDPLLDLQHRRPVRGLDL